MIPWQLVMRQALLLWHAHWTLQHRTTNHLFCVTKLKEEFGVQLYFRSYFVCLFFQLIIMICNLMITHLWSISMREHSCYQSSFMLYTLIFVMRPMKLLSCGLTHFFFKIAILVMEYFVTSTTSYIYMHYKNKGF
jgi:hypothetical protein